MGRAFERKDVER